MRIPTNTTIATPISVHQICAAALSSPSIEFIQQKRWCRTQMEKKYDKTGFVGRCYIGESLQT